MKNAIMLLGWMLIANTLIGQQILSVYSGYQPMVYHTGELDDKMTFLSLEPGLGGLLGAELKYTNKKEVSSIFSVDYSYSAFQLTSTWDDIPKFGSSNLAIQFNQLFVGYQIEYTLNRRIQFYISGGPQLGWHLFSLADGEINDSEDLITEIQTDTLFFDGVAKNQVSKGVLAVQVKTGIRVPIRKKMWWNLGIGLRADLTNNPEKDFERAMNSAINTLLYVQIFTGLSFDLGNVLTIEPAETD